MNCFNLPRVILPAIMLMVLVRPAFSQPAPRPYGKIPAARQISWQETEMYCIIHFSMATFNDKEWGEGDEPDTLFNPSAFNAFQIVNAAKAGDFKGIVVVAKHHDGFCLWPTKTTSHNISQSPYKNGRGDIVKEYEQACKKLHMKLGLYCSPWDRNNAFYGKPEYLKIYRAQLKELYRNYGPLFMSWHDGANGGTGYYGGSRELRTIDRTTYYDWNNTWQITRKLQPTAAIFGDVGPDVRWVGNEQGYAGETCWETYTPKAPDEGRQPANGYVKDWLGTEGTRNGAYWMPAECDVPLRPGWFYHQAENGRSKTPYMLLDLYYKSVGRGACLDLGLSPDKRGQITDEDVNVLKQFKALLDQTFSVNLAQDAAFTASNIRGNNTTKYGTKFLLDNDRYSYWATDDNVTHPELLIDLHKPKTFNVIRLRENIKLGQRIDSVAVDAWQEGGWKRIASVTSIGATRLIRLPNNVTSSKLRLKVSSPVCIALSDFGLFKEPVHLAPPVISRDKNGYIRISNEAPVASTHYTIDGTEPTSSSPLFSTPIQLIGNGTVKARSFDGKEQSAVATRSFDYSKTGWKIIGIDTALSKYALQMIDEDPHTFYSYQLKDSTTVFSPQSIDVDMRQTNEIKAFTYLPRQDNRAAGLVDRYAFYISNDDLHWQEAAKGEFSNIRSNPIVQVVTLKQPVKARYFRFTAEHVIEGNGMTVAEIGIR